MNQMVVFLSPTEREHFFNGIPVALLESLEIDFKLVDPTGIEDCRELLKHFSPDIILGAWDMPPLPLECLLGCGGSVEYLCYLSGSLEKKITPLHFERGLTATNWGKTTAPFVAECVLMLILCALRKVARFSREIVGEGDWRPQLTGNRSLFGKQVGLHGFGNIARCLVPLLKPFECEITADTGVPESLLEEFGVERAPSPLALFERSDVVVELKPASRNTRHVVDEVLLGSMMNGSCFVNVARGPVIDEEALLRVAREGRVQFALDGLNGNPVPAESPLLQLDNVLILPQFGGDTQDRGLACGQLALRNLRNYLSGVPLENRVMSSTYVLPH